MSDQAFSEPVVVTFDQVHKALGTQEAVGNIEEASRRDNSVAPEQRAAIMAGVGNVLDQLRQAEKKADAKVLTATHDARAARLQSLIASGDAAKLSLKPLPAGGLEAMFDTDDWFGWASVAWEKLKHLRPHQMLRPADTKAAVLPERARLALLGDWGTGLYGAPKIATAIVDDPDPFDVIMHLGDVYYSGTEKEVADRFLRGWPRRNGAINLALNSNHEMYSGGDAYFGKTLPEFGQQGSYFAYQNSRWTLVGLDVAYIDHAIDDEQVRWLLDVVRAAGERRIILFSHHQLYSSIESEQGEKLWSHPEFGELLRSKRIFAWYWGHEHRCTIYENPDTSFGILGRCIGHSGMPQTRKATIGLEQATGKPYERADWRFCPSTMVSGNRLSRALVLEGPNEFIFGEEEKFVPHGYAVLSLDGEHLMEEVRDARGTLIYSKQLA
ncbi:metallophosphoesterase [Bradyrhizobium sp. Gha]|uniref:metallophosphoesterase family protein n=1 Tax=Bradyrhizobium sp. Gha TaxID=1855318 RepID=UPI0008E8D68B|nr:metallophosphoesterase [Bradyrhizobium sp. Gha]SFI60944.1 Calcineurin-like phosphoesterase [Bradyrhizobium sp. Gha]